MQKVRKSPISKLMQSIVAMKVKIVKVIYALNFGGTYLMRQTVIKADIACVEMLIPKRRKPILAVNCFRELKLHFLLENFLSFIYVHPLSSLRTAL